MRGARAKEAAAGLLLIAIGLFAAWSARGLSFMSSGQMGPGYFPLVLALLLVLLGTAQMVVGLRTAAADGGFGTVPWRGVWCLSAAVTFFGLAVRPLGLGPALAVAVMLSCGASRRWRGRSALLLTLAMVVGCWLVFVRGLGLPIAFIGPVWG